MAHDHVENNPRHELLMALVGIALFAAMVVLIVLSAYLRPVAPDTAAMIAQREAAAKAAAQPAPANADTNTDLHINTYAITLGVRGSLWPNTVDPFTVAPVCSSNISMARFQALPMADSSPS